MDDGSVPENLMQVSKDIISLELCNDYWAKVNHPGGISSSKFCTRVENGRDSCKLMLFYNL